MNNQIKTICQNCKSEIIIEYIRLGLPSACKNCLRTTIPTVEDGSSIPLCGNHLTYLEFLSLLADASAHKTMSDYLLENFKYSINKTDGDYFVMSEKNESIDRAWLHFKIQNDTRLRDNLYNLAMSLWRS